MVFSSAYLDLPHWPQEHISHNHHIFQEINANAAIITTAAAATNPTALPPTTQPPQTHSSNAAIGSPGTNPTRPMTVSERARIGNIPIPEPALKCPRCDSTNTKFCYFNNYSLTQPRHFCKTCRRYWTRGGALRNVPVGGGCRRSRKPASAASKPTSAKQAAAPSTATANGNRTANNSTLQSLHRFVSPLGHGVLSNNADHLGFGNDESGLMMNAYGSTHMVEPWAAQLQFMGGLDPTANYGRFNCVDDQVEMRGRQIIPNTFLDQLGTVKMEESGNNHEIISRQLLMMGGHGGGSFDDHQTWTNNINNNNESAASCWNEIYGFSSSSASNALYLS